RSRRTSRLRQRPPRRHLQQRHQYAVVRRLAHRRLRALGGHRRLHGLVRNTRPPPPPARTTRRRTRSPPPIPRNNHPRNRHHPVMNRGEPESPTIPISTRTIARELERDREVNCL